MRGSRDYKPGFADTDDERKPRRQTSSITAFIPKRDKMLDDIVVDGQLDREKIPALKEGIWSFEQDIDF